MVLFARKIKRIIISIAKRLGLKKILAKLNFNYSISLNKKKMIIPVIQLMGLQLHDVSSEYHWMSNLIKKLFALKKGAFLDIGANVGQSLLIVKSFDEDMHYYGFEPNPRCVFYLKELTYLNKFTNCYILPIGLYVHSDILELYQKGKVDGAATIIRGFREGAKWNYSTDYIPVFSGDEVISKLGIINISIIKIDVEGGELEVLQGLANSVKKYRPFIICEILPLYDINKERHQDRKKRQDILIEMIKQNDYSIYRIIKNASGEIVFRRLDNIEIHSEPALCDYVFVPSEEIENIK